jgi:hypothetical protein
MTAAPAAAAAAASARTSLREHLGGGAQRPAGRPGPVGEHDGAVPVAGAGCAVDQQLGDEQPGEAGVEQGTRPRRMASGGGVESEQGEFFGQEHSPSVWGPRNAYARLHDREQDSYVGERDDSGRDPPDDGPAVGVPQAMVDGPTASLLWP